MKKRKIHNRGFSFVELLIAMTILSIVMLMVVNFMSMTTGAYRKTKKNLNIQTEALQVMEQMSDTLMQAAYIRVSAGDEGMYEVTYDSSNKKHKRTITKKSDNVKFDFVPDNYGNYLKTGDPFNMDEDVIIDMNKFDLVNKKGSIYPLSTGVRDTGLVPDHNKPELDEDVKSYRMLDQKNAQYYIQPDFIYLEYRTPSAAGSNALSDEMQHVIYKIVDDAKGHKKIYMYKYTAAITEEMKGFGYAVTKINQNCTGEKGLLTKTLKDFYLSVNVEGNSLFTNALFEDRGYEYNTFETINFRNSNVITVRPQRLYKMLNINNSGGGTTQNPGGGTTQNPGGGTTQNPGGGSTQNPGGGTEAAPQTP